MLRSRAPVLKSMMLGMQYAVRSSVRFVSRASACAAVLLLAGASGCSAAGDVERETYIEDVTATCSHVLDAGDLANPHVEETTAALNVRTYAEPLRETITISNALPVANQEAATAAIDAWREATSGYVDFQVVIGATVCDQRYAVHAAAQGECHLTGNVKKGYRVGFYTTSFGLTVRSTTAEGAVPSALETYITVLHEMGHALGLSHDDGAHIMNRSLTAMIDTPCIRASQLAKIAGKRQWPAKEMRPGTYAYESAVNESP